MDKIKSIGWCRLESCRKENPHISFPTFFLLKLHSSWYSIGIHGVQLRQMDIYSMLIMQHIDIFTISQCDSHDTGNNWCQELRACFKPYTNWIQNHNEHIVIYFLWKTKMCLVYSDTFIKVNPAEATKDFREWMNTAVNIRCTCVIKKHLKLWNITGTIAAVWIFPDNIMLQSSFKRFSCAKPCFNTGTFTLH